MKFSTAILLTLAILIGTGLTAYAVTALFFKGETQTSGCNKKTYFEFDSSAFFTGAGEIGPGESMSMNPVITSEATVDMYVRRCQSITF